MAKINITKKLSLSDEIINIIKAPHPYIGQYGPIKKPRFISLLSHIEQTITSNIHPRIEKNQNIKNKYTISAKTTNPSIIHHPIHILYNKKRIMNIIILHSVYFINS